MFWKSLLISFFLACVIGEVYAQAGSVRGRVVEIKKSESETKQDPIFGATVMIEGTANATATDIDGNFMLSRVSVGKCNLKITYIGYKEKLIEGVMIENGKIVTVNIQLEEDANILEGAVVVAQRETYSEMAVISEIKMAENVAVGISAEQINRSQDRDASQAIRRVPGVSLVDNRFVMVRGLAQRYNTVMLNDIITPSSEVDTRSFSFDIIPSNIIDRILIYKAGSSEIPGDFAGGVVKIYTRTAPEQNFTTAGLSIGFRNETTFRQAQTYKGGSLDFLGFDDGTRRLPQSFPAFISSNLSNTVRANFMNEFKGDWALRNTRINPDVRFNFGIGRRANIGDMVLGNITAINYSNLQQYFDSELNNFVQNNNDNQRFTQLDRPAKDKVLTNNIRLGVLSNWLLRINKDHSIEFKNLFNQLTFIQTVERNQLDLPNSLEYRNYSLRFESRSIYTGQLLGKHNFNDDKLKVNWQAGYAFTNRREPDWRRVRTNRVLGTEDAFRVSIAPSPNVIDAGRFDSNLNEGVWSLGTNAEWFLTKEKNNQEKAPKIRAGIYAERKDRTFNARFFGYKGIGNISNITILPYDMALKPVNVTGQNNSLTMEEGTRPQDKYTADNTLAAAYVGATLPISPKLSASVGFRGEYNLQQIQARRLAGGLVDVSNSIFSPLPSINITYDLNDKSLLRAAYSTTINRPEFRELAPFDYYDFNLNGFVIGNSELKNATIHNADLRYEYYPSPSEVISVGLFYKYFINPIEAALLLPTAGATNLGYSFLNAKNATNMGAEIEVRKSMAGVLAGKFFSNLSLVANASIIYSLVDLGEIVRLPDTDGTVRQIAVADTQDKERPMAFQSPYLINAGFYYNDEQEGWQFSVLYNVFGQRIFAVGTVDNPTVYERPRNIIDLSISKQINKKLELRFGVQDLLNQPFLLKQDSDLDNQITKADKDLLKFRRGQYVTLGINYNF